MSIKKTTFKQRIRKNDLKQRNKAASSIRKRIGAGRRVSNRFDEVDSGCRPMEEIVSEIAEGTAIPSQELNLDPRSLTDLLLRPATITTASSATKGTASAATTKGSSEKPHKVLPSVPLPEDDPLSLPDTAAIEDEERRRREALSAANAAGTNKNQYRHHGQPYLFWERVGLHPLLLQALRAMKFSHPTPVQEEVLPSVFNPSLDAEGKTRKKKKVGGASNAKKDVVVSAETGSGKTLVFALPILNDLLGQLDVAGQSGASCSTEEDSTGAAVAEGKRKRSSSSSSTSAKRGGEDTDTASTKKKKKLLDGTEKASVAAAEQGEEGDAVSAAYVKLDSAAFERRVMHSLIISPTRELALQINEAMKQLTQFAPQITLGCVVGGMAAEKQQRVLNRHPHILICTPGRLWELVQKNEGCYLGHSISRRLHYVVLDEADKMLQTGRFEELKNLLERIHCEVLPAGFVQGREEGCEAGEMEVEAGRWDAEKEMFVPYTPEELRARAAGGSAAFASSGKKGKKSAKDRNENDDADDDSKNKKKGKKEPWKRSRNRGRKQGEEDENNVENNEDNTPFEEYDDEEDEEDFGEEDEDEDEDDGAATSRGKKDQPRLIAMPANPADSHKVVTYVTSATLSLQTNYERRDFKANKSIIRTSNADVMGKVLQQLEIKPSNAQIFAVSQQSDVAAKINETYLRCPDDSKDLYLYYFLKTYRDDRAIVFVNAISMLRRLVKILEVLGVPVVGLHAAMQQRQRLKFIDKFKKGDIRVLVATDVASRGLDIDGLKYVVHYQVPRTTDAYIHRCGRTARCGGTGLSVLLVNAQEHISFRKLMESLGRKESDMEVFALQPTVVHQLHAHLRIALQIDKLQKEIDKSRASNQWVSRMSKQADIDVDDMYDDEADSENREKLKAIKVLKRELDLMVKKFTGSFGGKGAFRTGAHALGALEAEKKLKERADRQTIRVKQKRH